MCSTMQTDLALNIYSGDDHSLKLGRWPVALCILCQWFELWILFLVLKDGIAI